MQFDKRWGWFLFVVALWLWMGYHITSSSITPHIKVTIIQSKKPMRKLDDRIYPIKREALFIDKIDFPRSTRLSHRAYGNLGYSQNFVIYLDTSFYLDKEQFVKFIVYSDDGFRLMIDGRKIVQYPKDRPFSKSEGIVRLKPRKHRFHLKYFQGYGQLGLRVYYKSADTLEGLKRARRYLFGESSGVVRFDR